MPTTYQTYVGVAPSFNPVAVPVTSIFSQIVNEVGMLTLGVTGADSVNTTELETVVPKLLVITQ